jgi:hypothetical protein
LARAAHMLISLICRLVKFLPGVCPYSDSGNEFRPGSLCIA